MTACFILRPVTGTFLALLALLVPAFAEDLTDLEPQTIAPPASYIEQPFFQAQVDAKTLPPIAERVPKTPLVVDPTENGRTIGHYGGTIRTLATKAADLKYMTVNGYTRLVGYDENIELKPDLLEAVDNQDDRIFTFTLREGHKWSDGAPFTTEDFRYWWEDVAENSELSPAGPPEFMIVNGERPKVEILDERHIRYSWSKPNPLFLPTLALPRPTLIYAPAHYLKQFHAKYNDKARLNLLATQQKLMSWAGLHNKMDNSNNGNVDLPVLDPWHVVTRPPARRYIFERNPYYHRVDTQGHQLPYIDSFAISIAAGSLFAMKSNAGETDLLAAGLNMTDIPVLREGERMHGYHTLLWPIGRGSAVALYPNLTTTDHVWRKLLRDVRFRRALSLAIDRKTLNNSLWFGIGTPSNNTVLPQSRLFTEDLRTEWAQYDVDKANSLLDEIGLKRDEFGGFRSLPDGRQLEIVVEVPGDASQQIDALQIISEFWAEIGVKLILKPQDLTNMRERAYAGKTIMVAGAGLDNAVPTSIMPPSAFAPVQQDNLVWPKWGQYYETRGRSGEAPDTPDAIRLLDLYNQWRSTGDAAVKAQVWEELLKMNAENQYVIGTVNGTLQPIVISPHLRNVPEKALYAWEPTSFFGVYRMDQFYFDDQPTTQAAK